MKRLARHWHFLLAVALLLAVAGGLYGWSWYARPCLNAADANSIDRVVDGIGPEKALAIVNERAAGGEFRDWEDVEKRMAGRGIGPELVERTRKAMRLGSAP